MGGYCSSGEATLRNEPPLSEEMSRFLLAWGRIRLSRSLPAPRVLQRVFRGRKSTWLTAKGVCVKSSAFEESVANFHTVL